MRYEKVISPVRDLVVKNGSKALKKWDGFNLYGSDSFNGRGACLAIGGKNIAYFCFDYYGKLTYTPTEYFAEEHFDAVRTAMNELQSIINGAHFESKITDIAGESYDVKLHTDDDDTPYLTVGCKKIYLKPAVNILVLMRELRPGLGNSCIGPDGNDFTFREGWNTIKVELFDDNFVEFSKDAISKLLDELADVRKHYDLQ